MGFLNHRNADKAIQEIKIGKIRITDTETELKVGENPLSGRKELIVINDSSTLIYLNDRPEFDIEEGTIIAYSGEMITFKLNPTPKGGMIKRIYAKLDEGEIDIRIVEVK